MKQKVQDFGIISLGDVQTSGLCWQENTRDSLEY